MEIGDILLIPNPRPDKKHYHVIVADVLDNNMYVMVFISSIKEGREYDDSCVLSEGDAPFILRPSYAVYSKLYFADRDDIENRLSIGSVRYCGKASGDVMKKIDDGAFKSEWIKPSHMKYFKKDNQ